MENFSKNNVQSPFRRRWSHIALILALILTATPSALHAEKISKIDIIGNANVDSSVILKAMKSRSGSNYSRSAANQDLKRVYALGMFSDVQIEKQGTHLIVRVKERPVISEIVVQGTKKVSEDDVRAEISQLEDQVLSETRVQESVDQIKKLYSKEGMGFANIETEVEPIQGKNESRLYFKIAENKGHKIRKILFEGNTVYSTGKLRRFMKTKESGVLSFLTGSGKFSEEGLERDVAYLTYQYLNKGYLQVQIDKPEIVSVPNGVELRFKINEGDAYKVHDVLVEGDILTSKEELLKPFEKMKGKFYSQENLEENILKLNELYGNQGYAFATIRPRPRVNEATKELDVILTIEKGEKIELERINISGNTSTRDKVIRRELKVKENSLYNETAVRKSKQRLEALGYFESVEFSTPKGSAENKIDLNIEVKEKATGSISGGIGYSTAEGFLFNASISKQNFLGLGLNGSLFAELSKKRQQFAVEIQDPHFFESNWLASVNFAKIRTKYEDFDRDSLGGQVTFGHYIFDHSSISLGYKFEKINLDNFSLVVPELFKKNTDGITSSLTASIRRDTRNHPYLTTKGSYNYGLAEYAGLGGDNHFLRLEGNSRWFFHLPFWKNSVIRLNGRIGYIHSLNDEPIPLFERYYVGGINSVRGFRPRSLGPSVRIPSSPTAGDDLFVYGGNKLMVLNAEYEFPLYQDGGFRGVVFVDAGNAFAEDENINPLKLRTSFGFGLRWLSPFGPLRFEWGLPFRPKPGEDRIVFDFTIGTSF